MSTSGTSGAKPLPPLNQPTQTQPAQKPRPLRSPGEIPSNPTNWAAQQVESNAPRTRRDGVSGVTPRVATTQAAEPARAGSVDAQMRQQAQQVVLTADKCLDGVMSAVLNKEFGVVTNACKAVTEALAPIVNRRANKEAEAAWKAAEALSKATQSSKKESEAAQELASFRKELKIVKEEDPGIAEFTAEACGDRLVHLLLRLNDDQLGRLNEHLEEFLQLYTSDQLSAFEMSKPEAAVLHQLQFSVKAELLNRLMQKNKGSSDAETISKFGKDGLVELRELTTSLDRMVRPGTPSESLLPGARFTWTRITSMDTLAETRLNAILKTEGATRRVKNAAKTLLGNDPAQLKRLKGAIDFVMKSNVQLNGVSLPQLQKDVIARITAVEQGETDKLITPDLRKGPSNTFSAKLLSDAELVKLMNALLLEDDLTQQLEDVKKDVEAAINDRKLDAGAKFQKALRAMLSAKGESQVIKALLNSLAVAEASSASFKAVNWDHSAEGLADWMGEAFRGPKPGKRAGLDPADVDSLAYLRDVLTHGDGRVIRDLLAATQTVGNASTVAYLDLLNDTLHMLLDGVSAPLRSRAATAAALTPAGRGALQSILHLTVKDGRLVELKPVAQPTVQSPQTPRSQKN